MSASLDPQRVRDLVHKFGWDAIVRLAALGIQNLAEAQVFYVDSGATNALDADDGVHGLTIDTPLATIDYAIGLCTANEQSIIIACPGHNDSLGNAQMDFDVAGVKLIGIGHGSLTPRIDFDHANASIDIGANDVQIENIKLLPSVTGVLVGVDVESGVTGFKAKDVECMIGEDGAGVDEFVKAIELKSGNHDCIFENVKILAHASAANATHGINIAAASDRLTFKNVVIDGPYATGGIVEAAAGLNHVVEDCSIDTTGTNFSFHGSSTYAKYTRNVDAGVDSEEAEPLIEVARGTGNYPTGITNESIFAYIMGKGATASASTFDNTTDSLEAIADAIAAYTDNVSAAVPEPPVAKSLHDILHKDGNYTFDNTTDSLEAIADVLIAAIGSPVAGSSMDILKKMYYGADGVDVYPATVANDSTLAKIMSKGNPAAASSFNNTTDSLEAIADAVASISDNVTTAVPAAPTASSLQDILQKDATQDFDNTTDSLEAISDKCGGFSGDGGAAQDDSVKASLDLAHTDLDAILADTITISGGALPAAPTANSLARFVASGGTALGRSLPDSQSIVDLLGNYTGPYDGVNVDDNVKAATDHLGVDTDAIIAAVGTLVNTGGTATIGGIFGDAANSSFVTRFGNIQTEVNKIGTIVNTGGTATIGGLCGDFANSSLVTRLGNLQTEANKIGTVTNTGGTASIGAIFGDAANSSFVTRFGNIQTEVNKIGTVVNTGGTATLGAVIGDVANSDLVTRLGVITTDTAELQPRAANVASKTTTDLSGGGNINVFTVSGPVNVKSIVGVVANTIKAAAINLKLQGVPTAPGNAVDITNVVDINAAAIGSTLTPGATFGANLVKTANGVIGNQGFEFVMDSGVIRMNLDAVGDADDSIVWYIRYEPLSATSTIVAAA